MPDGHIDLIHLEKLLADTSFGKTMVSLMHANNEIGNLLDIGRVGVLCKEANAYFHSDTVQTLGHIPLKLKEWGVHFIAASAHKFNGPKGIGFIYINNNIKIKPFISGGAQERNMRGGTENIHGIVGMAKALEIAYSEMEKQSAYISSLKDYMAEKLISDIPGITFNGDYNGRSSYTVLNSNFPPSSSSEMLLFNLDIEGIAASGGSACTSGSDQGSHVLAQLDVPEGCSSVRFSFGKYNTREEIEVCISKLKKILKLEAVVS
jgi:cysteine desulfurase